MKEASEIDWSSERAENNSPFELTTLTLLKEKENKINKARESGLGEKKLKILYKELRDLTRELNRSFSEYHLINDIHTRSPRKYDFTNKYRDNKENTSISITEIPSGQSEVDPKSGGPIRAPKPVFLRPPRLNAITSKKIEENTPFAAEFSTPLSSRQNTYKLNFNLQARELEKDKGTPQAASEVINSIKKQLSTEIKKEILDSYFEKPGNLEEIN